MCKKTTPGVIDRLCYCTFMSLSVQSTFWSVPNQTQSPPPPHTHTKRIVQGPHLHCHLLSCCTGGLGSHHFREDDWFVMEGRKRICLKTLNQVAVPQACIVPNKYGPILQFSIRLLKYWTDKSAHSQILLAIITMHCPHPETHIDTQTGTHPHTDTLISTTNERGHLAEKLPHTFTHIQYSVFISIKDIESWMDFHIRALQSNEKRHGKRDVWSA